MHYCRALRFEDRPDYVYLRKMFKDLMLKMHYDTDYIYDWSLTEPPKRFHKAQKKLRPRRFTKSNTKWR